MESKDLRNMNSIEHPLHPKHSLTFFKGSDLPWYFICNGCREVKSATCDAAFGCKECEFYLDLKCAALMDEFFSKHDRQRYEEMEKTFNKYHFSDRQHDLKLCHLTESVIRSCFYCRKPVSDNVYCCLICDFFIHISCMEQMKEKVNHPFHPQHPLRAKTLAKDELKNCGACRGYDIRQISLSCEQCEFHLHYSCAREPFTRPIKLDRHDHRVYYFGGDTVVNDFTCELCTTKDKDAIYRCLECSWPKHGNFHVKCVGLQNRVKHEIHVCDLTLSSSVGEVIEGYDAAEYRCDICEQAGNSRHHVYGCEECNFIAHIECVISTKIQDDIRNPGSCSDDKAAQIGDLSNDKETIKSIKSHVLSEAMSTGIKPGDVHGSSSQVASNSDHVDPTRELKLKVDELREEMKKYRNMFDEMNRLNQIQEEMKQMRELFKQLLSGNRPSELSGNCPSELPNLMIKESPPRFNKKGSVKRSKELNNITRALASPRVGAALWAMKSFSVKLLAASFHFNRFFYLIQDATFQQYLIQTLSGPPLMEMAEETESTSTSMLSISRNVKDQENENPNGGVIDIGKLKKIERIFLPAPWKIQ